jgi:phosphoesterase RecJ-like protein
MTQELKQLLATSDNWLITTHKGPDGDAIGSVVAWFHIAKQLQKTARVLLPDEPAAFLQPFLKGIDWEVFQPDQAYAAEALFCLDYNAPSRVGEHMADFVRNFNGTRVMIDHHPNPDPFCQVQVSRPQHCSTTELIYVCLQEMEQLDKLNLEMARGIYLGLMTDTGSFRFPSVSALTHQIAGHLLTLGLKHHEIHEAIYDVNSVERLQLRGFAIAERLELLSGVPAGILYLTKTDLERFSYQKGDTEGLVNVVLSIEGIQLAVFLMETSEGIKLSFRSKGAYFVNAFAASYFAGGGHQYAAGGFSTASLTDCIAFLKTRLVEIKPA